MTIDPSFGSRFAKSYPYGFYIFDSAKDVSVNDVVDNEERWLLLSINPQTLNLREPFATSITPGQGGGVTIESNGQVLKQGSISGTTGHLPMNRDDIGVLSPITGNVANVGGRRPLVPNVADLDEQLGLRSGFLAFHKLRNLFRLYGTMRKAGSVTVSMHFMNYKDDEFWRIEPGEFSLRRNSKRPMLYDYDINFTCIAPSNHGRHEEEAYVDIVGFKMPPFPGISVAPRGLNRIATIIGSATNSIRAYSVPTVVESVVRVRSLSEAGLGFVNRLSGAVQSTVQNVLRVANDVVGFFDDIHSTMTALQAIPVGVLRQLRSSVEGARAVMYQFAEDNIKEELNSWLAEMAFMVNGLISFHINTFNTSPGSEALSINESYSTGRAKSGSTTDLLTESATSLGTPDYDPLLGVSGLGLVTDLGALSSVRALRAVPIGTGDTIYSIAMRYLGSISRAIDLIVLNGLESPYIVASQNNRPSGTLAWGDFINIPSDGASGVEGASVSNAQSSTSGLASSGTTTKLVFNDAEGWFPGRFVGYTLILTRASSGVAEDPRVVVESDENSVIVNNAYGAAILINDKFDLSLTYFSPRRPLTAESVTFGRSLLLKWGENNKATLVKNARGGLAQVTGLDNFIQAMRIRLATEPGSIPWHPQFGVSFPIGRPFHEGLMLVYTYFARRSLLSDPRVESVSNARIAVSNGVFSFSASIKPVHALKSRNVSVSR